MATLDQSQRSYKEHDLEVCGALRRRKRYNGVNAIVTEYTFPIYKPFNRMDSAIHVTVCQAPCYSEFNTFDVKLSVITLCLTVIF